MSAITITDRSIPFTSTIPANATQQVRLFVREYDGTRPGHERRPVLMLHGRSAPAAASFDLVLPHDFGDGGPEDRYSWARYLAGAGYDVFIMDIQGNGQSTRPAVMDVPCNANPAQQLPVLVPNPLPQPCTPRYDRQLGNSESEWAELTAVVRLIRGLSTDRDKPIECIGWSSAAFVLGPYALQHPADVARLILLAPIFPPQGRWSTRIGDPFGRPPEAPTMPVSQPPKLFGFPLNVGSKSGFASSWDIEQGVPEQREPGMTDQVWEAMIATDDVGLKWGRPSDPHGPPEGVLRFRNSYWWGWNDETVPLTDDSGTPVLGGRVPVLILYGAHDTQANNSPALPPAAHFSVPDLYQAIAGREKLMFRYADAGHMMAWERPAKFLHHMSRQWLDEGKVEGLTTGSYLRDANGEITPVH
ncbi:alpha/beta fold hydrolase [Streptomyces sp. CoH27]|uniref:alpha/beta fold hydrolase n=1 Tax=Streptomyces sp. CoH27 TaxID=2875763 RepID=UPI001CD25D54|nr:alpha/beta fold hydrolase [Streptomyces sp. CoH27]